MSMWTNTKNFPARGFSTPPPTWKSSIRESPVMMPRSERKWNSHKQEHDLFHVSHKVPPSDSPYGRAKHVQLVDKDPSRAISMFWAAINSGDRVDSALKDMATVMKQLNRSDEAIEAIKSFRHLCPLESQESIDNVLLELYKRSGRVEEQIEMLEAKLKHIEEGIAFGGRRKKPARSQGKKIQITVEREHSRLLGNLAWAYLQQNNYKSAEELYRKALSLEQDKNKQCNLAICLMYLNKMTEAKFLLEHVRSSENGLIGETYAKSFDRATQILAELESQSCWETQKPFSFFLGRNSGEFQSPGNVGYAYMNECASPDPAGGGPAIPFSQPRRGCYSFINGDQKYVKHNAATGCSRKLLFAGTKEQEQKSEVGRLDSEAYSVPAKYDEVCDDFSLDRSKKSWADMVEEEQKLPRGGKSDCPEPFHQTNTNKYFDENVNCNILFGSLGPPTQTEDLCQKMESLVMKNEYYSQPGNADLSMNCEVQRSLCFRQQQQKTDEEDKNRTSSSSWKKDINFGSYDDYLAATGSEYTSGNCTNFTRRNRLQVFRDITLCDSPRRP